MSFFGQGQTRLTTHSSSPTTTEYTVTNARPYPTPVAKLLLFLRLGLRALFALLILAILFTFLSEALQSVDAPAKAGSPYARAGYAGPLHDWVRARGLDTDKRATWIATGLCCVFLWLLSRRRSFEESLLVVRGLGIQISTSSYSYLSTTTTRFIPTTAIQDIFIHEAFVGFEVKFYLAIIVEGEKEAVVVFPKLMPRRYILEEVWRGSRGVLYQQQSGQGKKG